MSPSLSLHFFSFFSESKPFDSTIAGNNGPVAFSERRPQRKKYNQIDHMPYSHMPLKVARVGDLESIVCDLNKVTRRIHQNKPSPNDSLNQIWRC